MAATTRNLQIILTAKDDTAKAFTSASKGMGGIEGAASKVGSALAAIGMVAFLKDAVSKAMAAEESWGQLSVAVKNTGQSFADAKPQIQGVLAQLSQTSAFSQGELRGALTGLVQQTKDLTQSENLLALAADLSRARHIDLNTAAKLVGRVAQGNTTALQRYGIVLGKNATATQALAELNKRVGGAAKEFGDSTEGAVARANNSLNQLKTNIGTAVLPAVTNMANKMSDAVTDFNRLPGSARNAAVEVGALGAAFLIATPYIKGFNTALVTMTGSSAWGLITKLSGNVAVAGEAFKTFGGEVSFGTSALAGMGAGLGYLKASQVVAQSNQDKYNQSVSEGSRLAGAWAMIAGHAAQSTRDMASSTATLDTDTMDLARAFYSSSGAAAEVRGTVDKYSSAISTLRRQLEGLRGLEEGSLTAKLAVKQARKDMAAAVKEFGAKSDEARLAQLKLADAEDEAKSKAKAYKDAFTAKNDAIKAIQAIESAWNDAAAAAQRAASKAHAAIQANKGGGTKAGPSLASGGIANGPKSGYAATLHGREAVLPLDNPARVLQVLSEAGIGFGEKASAAVSSAANSFALAGGGSYAGGPQEVRIFLDGRELSRSLGQVVNRTDRTGAR